MPLSFGIPAGLIVVLIGAVLFLVSKNKKNAMIIIELVRSLPFLPSS
jgi:hypothetical protein